MTLNENRYNPAASTFLLVVGLALKSPHMHSMLWRIESTGRYTHHKQVIVVYYIVLHRKGKLTIAKLKSSRLSYNVVVSLPFESKYEADLSDSVVSFISSSSKSSESISKIHRQNPTSDELTLS